MSALGSILVVCTGNICRSPAIEVLLRAALPRHDVSSAGTRAVVGAGIALPVATLLAADGHASPSFAARQLRADQLRAADLILTATVDHRAAAVELAPAVVRRAFTVLEFARIAAELGVDLRGPSGTLGGLVPRIAAARFPVAPGEDDLRDPYGESIAVHQEVYERARTAVGRMTGERVAVS